MVIDWYQASVPSTVDHCKAMIFSEREGHLESCPPIHPFKFGLKHSKSDFHLYHGGCNPLPHFKATGEAARDGFRFLRETYPTHRVSRVDVASDYDREGGFDEAFAQIEPIARQANVAVEYQGDWGDGATRGRTIYFGSKNSDVRICMYEKGLKEIAEGSQSASEGWFRVELRVRPRKERKALCAALSASELWGLSKWTVSVVETVLGTLPEFHPDMSMRETTTDRAISHMLKQYGRHMRVLTREKGRKELDRRISEELERDA